jgi:trehalose 6-phosphate synthase
LLSTAIDATRVDWSLETLHLMLESQLPDAEIIVVSNREPNIHNHVHDGIALQPLQAGLWLQSRW